MTVGKATIGYGTFEIVVGVPDDYDQHRCQYAREYVADKISENMADSWVVQKAKPVEPREAKDNHTYYRFGGNLLMEELR